MIAIVFLYPNYLGNKVRGMCDGLKYPMIAWPPLPAHCDTVPRIWTPFANLRLCWMISASQQGQSRADSYMLDRTWQDCQEFRYMSIRSTGWSQPCRWGWWASGLPKRSWYHPLERREGTWSVGTNFWCQSPELCTSGQCRSGRSSSIT